MRRGNRSRPRSATIILYGSGDEKIPVHYQNRTGDQRIYSTTFEGIINNLRRRYLESTSDYIRSKIEGYMAQVPCPTCQGKRLKPAVLAVTVGGQNIQAITSMPVVQALAWVKSLRENKRAERGRRDEDAGRSTRRRSPRAR